MHKHAAAAVLVPLLVAEFFYFQPRPSPDKALQSVVRIESSDGWGSGVSIGSLRYWIGESKTYHTLILTAAHVVEKDATVKVHIGDKVLDSMVLKANPDLDLALIEIDAQLPPIPLGKQAQFGQEAWAVGYALNEGAEITQGYVSSVREHGLEASTSIYPGDSGGALIVYDHGYKLVGILDALRTIPNGFTSQMASTVSFSVPLEKIREFLK